VLLICYHHDVICILLQWRRTALHYAADNGHDQVVEKLIELGADLNAFDDMVSV